VHGSKLSRQSIMYVSSPRKEPLPFCPTLAFSLKTRPGLGLVVGIGDWGGCLETPHKYLVYSAPLSSVCEVSVPASLNVCHTRFNWLLYLWLQFASLLCFLIKCFPLHFGPTCAVIDAIAKPN